MRLFWLLWSISCLASVTLCTLGYILPYWLKGSVLLAMYDLEDSHESVDVGPNRAYRASYMGLFRRCVYPVYAEEAGTDSGGHAMESGTTPATVLISSPVPEDQSPREIPKPLVKWRIGCGHYHLRDVPHATWQLGMGCLTLACILLAFFSLFLLLTGFELSLLVHQLVLYRVCQCGLLFSGLLTLTACGLYPLGWRDNQEVGQICGRHLGGFGFERCRLGWAYMLTLLGGFMAIFSAGLPSLYFRQICLAQTCWQVRVSDEQLRARPLANRYPSDKPDLQQLYPSSSSYMAMANSLDESMCLQPASSSGLRTPRLPVQQCLWPSTPVWTPCVLVPAKSQSEFSGETTGSFECSSVRLEKKTPVPRKPAVDESIPSNL